MMIVSFRRLAAFAVAGLLVIVACGQRPTLAADQQAARAFIDDLGRRTISVLEDTGLSYDEARDRFRTLFLEGFDTATIGRFVLGRYWRGATDEQRQTYQQLFEDMVVETYTRRFREYSGESLQIEGSRPEGDNDVMVQTSIVRPGGGPPVAVTWRVRERDGTYQIIDVVIEGISMSVTQRNEFGSIIQRNGGDINALFDAMRANIEAARRGT